MWGQIFTVSFITALLAATVRMAVPLMYAGLGELFLERAGILNIGLEGVMLSGAFCAFAGAYLSGSLIIGLCCAILGGIFVSVLHGWLCITLKQNQSVSGIALNILMLGLTSFLYKLLSNGQSYQQILTFPVIAIPGLSRLPIIGSAFFNQDILTYGIYLLLIITAVFYRKTAAGLAFAAIGEHPRAADSAGIAVYWYQWIAIIVNGALGGIGGGCLVLVQLGKFTENMVSGRGYIALAAVILGRYNSLGMFGAALLFGGANALQIRLQTMGVAVPSQALAMLPYVITLVALLGTIGKSNGPANLGIPYIRGSR